MSFSDFRNAIPDDPTDDDPATDDIGAVPLKTAEKAGDTLARLMLEAALTPSLRRLLETPSRLLLIRVEDEAAATLLASYLRGPGHSARRIALCTERVKSGGRLEPVGQSELSKLEDGTGVVLISQDPENILVPEALGAADAIIAVPNPTLAIVRRAIRAVSGKTVRGLVQPDIDGLGIRDLLACIRPGLSADDCVRTLRRAALFKRKRPDLAEVISLEKLAMTREVAEWANSALDLMHLVTGGSIDTSALRFACLEGPPWDRQDDGGSVPGSLGRLGVRSHLDWRVVCQFRRSPW